MSQIPSGALLNKIIDYYDFTLPNVTAPTILTAKVISRVNAILLFPFFIKSDFFKKRKDDFQRNEILNVLYDYKIIFMVTMKKNKQNLKESKGYCVKNQLKELS